MKTESIFTLLFIVTTISTYSHAHDNVEFTDNTSIDINQEDKAIQDKSKRDNRNFLAYNNVFGVMRFGDAIEKLGEDRRCNSVSIPDDIDGNKTKLITCKLAKDYGSIEGIPIYDVEYLFHKLEDKQLMTGINIFLYKSDENFSKDFHIASPSENEIPKSLMSAPKINYVIQRKCNNAALKFTEVWGSAETDRTIPKWIDKNNNVEASLVGVACNILNMNSLDLLNRTGAIVKDEPISSSQGEI